MLFEVGGAIVFFHRSHMVFVATSRPALSYSSEQMRQTERDGGYKPGQRDLPADNRTDQLPMSWVGHSPGP
jgi:hypothetical protein